MYVIRVGIQMPEMEGPRLLSSSSLSSGSMTRSNRTGDRSLEYASLNSECGGQLAINLHFALAWDVCTRL